MSTSAETVVVEEDKLATEKDSATEKEDKELTLSDYLFGNRPEWSAYLQAKMASWPAWKREASSYSYDP